MKIKIEDVYFKIIMLFPIATLFQGYLGGLNKIFFALLLFFQIILFINKINFKQFIIMFTVLAIFIYNYLITKGSLYNINELFYYPFSIMYLLFFYNKLDKIYNFICRERKFIDSVLNIWSFIIFISIFLKSSWSTVWGGGVYFGSFCGSIFRLAPSALFIGIISICCMNIYNQKKYFYYLFLPLFCFLMGGSRTYLFVGLLVFVLGWYFFIKSKKKFLLTIIPISFLLVFLVINSTIMDKFAAVSYTSSSYFDFWGTVTNGRSVFWEADLKYFINSSFISKLFGNGFNCIYEINYLALNDYIWAHNDFIQILISHGLYLLFIYVFSIYLLFKYNLNFKTNRFLVIAVFVIWIFNAIFNMCYTYFCALLSLPFMIIFIKYYKNNSIN